MTYQEILEGITRHRANPVGPFTFGGHPADGLNQELRRKFDEIEWALQALAEKLRDEEDQIDRANQAIIADMKRK